MKTLILAAAVSLIGNLAQAQSTPAGVWKTIDDASKKEKSLVHIVESGGVFTGKIEKLLDRRPSKTKCAISAPTIARASRSSA